MRQGIKNYIHLLSANSFIKVLGLVSIPVYTNFLSVEELAILPAFELLGRLSQAVFSFGILPTLVRDIPSLINKSLAVAKSRIFTSTLIIIPGILVFSVACFLFSESISTWIFKTGDYAIYIRILSIGIFFHGINETFGFIFWCLSRFKAQSKVMATYSISRFILGVTLVIFAGIKGLAIALSISAIVSSLLSMYYLRDMLSFRGTRLYPIKTLIADSIPFYLESYLMYFRAQGDQLVVASMLGAKSLSIYYIARRLYFILDAISNPLDKVITASLAKEKDNILSFNEKLNQIITLNVFILCPIFLFTIATAPTFIVLIAGPEYGAAVIPAMILASFLLLQVVLKSSFLRSIFILKPSVSRFKFTLLETFILLSLIWVFGQLWGILGIALSRLTSSVITGIMAYLYVKNDIKLQLNLKAILIIITASLILGFSVILLQHYFSNYLILISGVLMLGILFLTVINKTISKYYYGSLNKVSPFQISDPISYLSSYFNKA